MISSEALAATVRRHRGAVGRAGFARGDKGAPPYALAGLSRELWATAAALLGAPCVGVGMGDDELNLMLSMPSRPEWDGTVGAVERRVRWQAAQWVYPGATRPVRRWRPRR
jgi:hypothetical protein